MGMLRKIFSAFTFGALVGIAGATVWGPQYLEWKQSMAAKDAMCQCTELVRNTAHDLIVIQLYGALGGAVVSVIAWAFIERSLSKRRARKLAEAAQEQSASQINPPSAPQK